MSGGWLILHGGALGDLILTLQLALRLPGARATDGLRVVSRVDPGDLTACQPPIRRRSAEPFGLHWLHTAGETPPPTALRELVRGARVLNALGAAGSGVHKRLAELGPAELLSFDPRPQPDGGRHITDQWRTQLEQQGRLIPKCVHQRPQERGLGVPAALRTAGRTRLGLTGDTPLVVLHPGSGGRAKCWPVEAFLSVADALQPAGRQLRAILGVVELERWSEADLQRVRHALPTCAAPRPAELVEILAAADAYLGNDSGPTHLAALLGVPTCAVFGPTPAAVWRPLGPHVTVLAGRPEAGLDWGVAPADVARALLGACEAGRA